MAQNEKPAPTRGEKVNADIAALLRARHVLLWVVTREEVRVERAIVEAAAAAKFPTSMWDCATGLSRSEGATVDPNGDPNAVLNRIRSNKSRMLYILRDLHQWKDPVVLRMIRTTARELENAKPDEARAIVVLTPSAEVPPDLAGQATVIEYPLPDRTEVGRLLDDVISALPPDRRASVLADGVRDQAVDAGVGLTANEVFNCYSKSLVTAKRIDPVLVGSEKKRVIARERVLTWHDPEPRGLDAIGGLDLLKEWLRARRSAFSAAARAYGLPAPKGAMLAGLPGCGKSLTAKAVAAAWGMPLLRLDMGALRSKYVGESEGNIRKALSVAETVSPCVLWLDEIEKALAGASGPAGDGGVAADALGTVLSWMQEREGSVFVIATANDVRSLPPELLRKGRFDEVFWVDLPTAAEREDIVRASLRSFKRDPDVVDVPAVARVCDGFTGAEIAAIVPDAMFAAFADNAREITTDDLLTAAATVVPLSKTAAEKVETLREWAKTRARPASRPEDKATASSGRTLEID